MNKFILEELNKTKIILPNYDANTTEMLIPKSGSIFVSEELTVGDIRTIYVEDYIINEPENFTLSTNWNHGTKPPENRLKVQIVQINGKMIKVVSVGVNTNIRWDGWLPRKSIKVIAQ